MFNLFKKKPKNIPDERIKKESNCLLAKMYYVIILLAITSFIVKLVCRLPFYMYILEILLLLVSIVYIIVSEGRKGILFVKEKDEAIKTMHEEVLANAINISFWILLIGEVPYLFTIEKYFIWILSFFVIWLIPGLIITIISIKNGWLIWGSKKREAAGKKSFKKSVAIGALVYSVFMGFFMFFKDGDLNMKEILSVLRMGAMWGVLFYAFFTGSMKLAEKKADKRLEEQEHQENIVEE